MISQKLALVAALAVSSSAFACPPAAKAQAQKYKDAIGKSTFPSESDYPWKTFCSDTAVSGFSEAELRKAVGAGKDDEIEVWDHQTVLEILDHNSEEEDTGDAASRYAYARLKSVLLLDFSELRIVRVIDPEDSAEVKMYLVGRDAAGRLIGLRTISIET